MEETEKDWKILMDTKGTFSINENVPYENKTNKGKFATIPAITPDGTALLQTRVYPEGISYITKLLRKYGYLEVA